MNSLHILIPTFSRRLCVERLMDFFIDNFYGNECLSVTIFDNSEVDQVPRNAEMFLSFSNFDYHRHAENIGGSSNIKHCLNAAAIAKKDYFWIIPDDIYPNKDFIISLIEGDFGSHHALLVREGNEVKFNCCPSNYLRKKANCILLASWLPSVIYKKNDFDISTADLQYFAANSYPHLPYFLSVFEDSSKKIGFCEGAFVPMQAETRYNFLTGSAFKVLRLLKHNYGNASGASLFFELLKDHHYNKSISSSMIYESGQVGLADLGEFYTLHHKQNFIFIMRFVFAKFVLRPSLIIFCKIVLKKPRWFTTSILAKASRIQHNFNITMEKSVDF